MDSVRTAQVCFERVDGRDKTNLNHQQCAAIKVDQGPGLARDQAKGWRIGWLED